jgi:hypothetical protein
VRRVTHTRGVAAGAQNRVRTQFEQPIITPPAAHLPDL